LDHPRPQEIRGFQPLSPARTVEDGFKMHLNALQPRLVFVAVANEHIELVLGHGRDPNFSECVLKVAHGVDWRKAARLVRMGTSVARALREGHAHQRHPQGSCRQSHRNRSGGTKRARGGNEDNPLGCDLNVTSMVDLPMMHARLRARPSRASDPGRRRRPTAVRSPWPGAGGHHRLGRGARCAADRGLSAGSESRIIANAHRIIRVACPTGRGTRGATPFRVVPRR
jgi:hypothetical protein